MSDKGIELPAERRREMFAALVTAQDEGLSVAASRENIAQRFGVGVEVVREVEEQGLDYRWPPFGKG